MGALARYQHIHSAVIYAFVLMGNHYHLLLEISEANLVVGTQWLQSTYTKRFNARHREWGEGVSPCNVAL